MRQIRVAHKGVLYSYWFVLFVNFYIIRYGDTVEQTRARFPASFAPMILANHVPLSEWEGGDNIIGANQAGKCACSLLNCISVTDDSDTNEQNKSIATGLLYAHSEFDAFSTLLRGEMWISNPRG